MSSISEQIMEYAQTLPEGSLLRPRDFMRLGSGPAVYGAFSRLLRQDRLMRIYRGLYVLTIETRFGKCGPRIEKVIKVLSELWGETIVYPAGRSANFLGLTTQVPMRRSYFTSGPTRQLHFGALKVYLHHAPSWQLVGGDRPAGVLIRALVFLHPDEAEEAISKVVPRVFSEEDVAELLSLRPVLPKWMVEAINAFSRENR